MDQSMAQLDLIYGVNIRKVIFDNCQYKLILQAGDAETQQYLSRLIGSGLELRSSLNISMDAKGRNARSLTAGASETREFRIHPHMLATLEDAVFLTPQGVCRIEKCLPHKKERMAAPRPAGQVC